jgi:RNA recognition motif-containing protein
MRADVMTGPDGRSKGCGVVEFDTVEGAQKAVLTLNNTELNGRQIFVREDREEGRSTAALGSPSGGSHFSSGEKSQSHRVYVGNLSWDVAWQDLKDHMREAGEVLHAEVITEANGRSKGCGIVEYATEEEAQEAINTLTDTELKGRMIFVREDRETGATFHGGAGNHSGMSVYVWNLSFETTWQELKDHARLAGNVDQATILTGSDGESIGCGIVVYQRPQEAARAIRELQNTELNGRTIYAREDRMQPGGGRGFGSGRGRGRGRGHGGRHQGGRGGGRSGGHVGGRGGGRGDGQLSGGDGCQLYVGNLSYDTTWQDLKDHFRQCGNVSRAEVMEYPDGKKKGFGLIRFSNQEEAQEAIDSLNGVELQGRDLEVRMDAKAL